MKTIDVIKTMLKAIDKKSLRQYAQVIGFREGKYCVTDGLAMLVWETTQPMVESEHVVDVDLQVREGFPFPQFGQVISQPLGDGGQVTLDVVELDGVLQNVSVTKNMACILDVITLSLATGSGMDLAVFTRFRKALPKGAKLTGAKRDADSTRLEFSSDVGTFIYMQANAHKPEKKAA